MTAGVATYLHGRLLGAIPMLFLMSLVVFAIVYMIPGDPIDAMLGYAIRIGSRRITGEVDRIQAARERFERALLDGRSAGLVDQERPNLFTLELGNVPPGGDVVAELTIDQRLAWLGEGAWEWRFPTAVAPRYLGPRAGYPMPST